MGRLITAESVTEGHPDKICDQISDAILDEYLKQDPFSRVACETAVTTNFVLVMGEITSNAKVDIESVVQKKLEEIGYNNTDYGFESKTCEIEIRLNSQSQDIAAGVNKSLESKKGEANLQLGAGDQGIVFGYATDETEDFMPLAASLANKLSKKLADLRHKKTLPYLRPDGKTQVTVEYNEDGKPLRVDTVVVSAQHNPDIGLEKLSSDLKKHLIHSVIPKEMTDKKTRYFINPTGSFVTGGPKGDSGLTGRKIVADCYGGYAHHGGGAFSGKDYTKIDRSAAYAARYIAKNIVAAELASKCEVQLSYVIGVARPISIDIDTFQTEKVNREALTCAVKSIFDLTLEGLIEMLDLKKPIYSQTSCYGHFGENTRELPWEKTDKTEQLINSIESFSLI